MDNSASTAAALGPATDRRCGQCKSTHGWCNLCQRKKQRTAESTAALKSPVLWQAAVHEMLIKLATESDEGGMPEEGAVLLALRAAGLEQPWSQALAGMRARMAASGATYGAWTAWTFEYEAAHPDRGARDTFSPGERVELTQRKGGGFGTVQECRTGRSGVMQCLVLPDGEGGGDGDSDGECLMSDGDQDPEWVDAWAPGAGADAGGTQAAAAGRTAYLLPLARVERRFYAPKPVPASLRRRPDAFAERPPGYEGLSDDSIDAMHDVGDTKRQG
jgi:hypothetical protein